MHMVAVYRSLSFRTNKVDDVEPCVWAAFGPSRLAKTRYGPGELQNDLWQRKKLKLYLFACVLHRQLQGRVWVLRWAASERKEVP